MSNDFNNINFKRIKRSCVIHIEVDGTNYLQDTILKFDFMMEDHVVIDSDQLKEYPELIKWLENETTEKLFMMLKHTLLRID